MKWHKFIGEYSKLPSLSRTESKNELVSDSFIVNENGENYIRIRRGMGVGSRKQCLQQR